MFRYISGSLVVALVGALAYGKLQSHRAATLSAENASMARSIDALNMQHELSVVARNVEAARADRFAAQVQILNASVEALLTGDIPDENLDPRIADFINGVQPAPD